MSGYKVMIDGVRYVDNYSLLAATACFNSLTGNTIHTAEAHSAYVLSFLGSIGENEHAYENVLGLRVILSLNGITLLRGQIGDRATFGGKIYPDTVIEAAGKIGLTIEPEAEVKFNSSVVETARQVIIEGCGCDRHCETIGDSSACGCRNEARAILHLGLHEAMSMLHTNVSQTPKSAAQKPTA
jgi:hypothetical protein